MSVAFATAQRAGVRRIDSFSYNQNNNDGQYRPDNSGAYHGDDGRYHPDNSGQYRPDDLGKYDYIYKQDADRFGNGDGAGGGAGGAGGAGGRYVHVGDGFGSGGSGAGAFGVAAGGSGSGSAAVFGSGSADSNGAILISGRVKSPAQPAQAIFVDAVQTVTESPARHHYASGSSGIQAGAGFGAPVALKTGSAAGLYDNRHYGIIRQVGHNEEDGYHYLYETENGITGEEQGKLANRGTDNEAMRASGFYTYTGPDNVVYTVEYTADENGFVPNAAHIPTPPPIPEAILRSLEYQKSVGVL